MFGYNTIRIELVGSGITSHYDVVKMRQKYGAHKRIHDGLHRAWADSRLILPPTQECKSPNKSGFKTLMKIISMPQISYGVVVLSFWRVAARNSEEQAVREWHTGTLRYKLQQIWGLRLSGKDVCEAYSIFFGTFATVSWRGKSPLLRSHDPKMTG